MSRPDFFAGKRAGFAGIRASQASMAEVLQVLEQHLKEEGDVSPAAFAATLAALYVASAGVAQLDLDSTIAVVRFYDKARKVGVCAADNPFEPMF